MSNNTEPKRLRPANQKALQDFDQLPDSANVRAPVAAAVLGISEVSVWRWSARGKLPKPTRLGVTTTWNVGALRRLLAEAS